MVMAAHYERINTTEPHTYMRMGAQEGTFKMIPNILNFRRCQLKYLEVSATTSASNLPSGSGKSVLTHIHRYR